MELMVRDGDYVSDERGGFRRAEGSEELLQRVLWKLSIRRGCFPPLPGLGSQLYRLAGAQPARRGALARQYVTEALAEEESLLVDDVILSGTGTLQVRLTWRGETLRLDMDVQGA